MLACDMYYKKQLSPVSEDRAGMLLFNMALPAKVTSKQRPEDSEEVSHENVQWKNGTDRGMASAKGLRQEHI